MSQHQNDLDEFMDGQRQQTRNTDDLRWLVGASLLSGFWRWVVVGAWLGKKQGAFDDQSAHNLWWAIKTTALILLLGLIGVVTICLIWGNY